MHGKYLLRTASGQYRFRIRIPTYLVDLLGIKEIRKSLETDSLQLATLRAVRLAATYKLAFTNMKKKTKNRRPKRETFSTELITFFDSNSNPVTIDFGGDKEMELQAARELMSLSQKGRSGSPPTETQTTLSEALSQYLAEKRSRGLVERSLLDYEAALNDFIELHGNTPLSSVTRDSVIQVYNQFKRLPSNRRKLPEFRDKNLHEILSMPCNRPMSKTTHRKFITRVSQFFNWCVYWEKMTRNPAAGLVEKAGDGSNDRHPFNDEDLRRLFSSTEFRDKSFKHPYQYWVPLIALFTGARINEICQLRPQDILVEEGIHCIHFTGDAGNLKTQASKRLIPIHEHLVECGLIVFVNHIREKNSDRLFPELRNGREGPGQTASKWFSRYRKRCDINDPKKTFHSFRHTVATRLSYEGCQDYEIADVLGHKTSMITTSRYRERMLPTHLQKTIHKLKFPFIATES